MVTPCRRLRGAKNAPLTYGYSRVASLARLNVCGVLYGNNF
jgi:hypothetical protein